MRLRCDHRLRWNAVSRQTISHEQHTASGDAAAMLKHTLDLGDSCQACFIALVGALLQRIVEAVASTRYQREMSQDSYATYVYTARPRCINLPTDYYETSVALLEYVHAPS